MGVEFEAYAAFERELLSDLIPFIESKYSVQADRETARSPVCRWAAASR
jgi:enterochelin esterase-like enzyme